jgi:hypothetical protein
VKDTAETSRSPIPGLAKDLDEGIDGRVLVFGSLPPQGRDLDLLARPDQFSKLEMLLRGEGFIPRGQRWARFAGPDVALVELVPAERWQLPARELAALFA